VRIIKNLNNLAWWLLVVGGLNWGLVGLGNFVGGGNWNLVQTLVGSWQGAADLVYVVVGGAALLLIWNKVSK